jgi:hypothetical protein
MDAQRLNIACHVLISSEESTCMFGVCMLVFNKHTNTNKQKPQQQQQQQQQTNKHK